MISILRMILEKFERNDNSNQVEQITTITSSQNKIKN